LGIAVALLCFKFLRQDNAIKDSLKVAISQSKIHEVIKPAIPILEMIERLTPKETQASKFEKSQLVRVMVIEGEAYWIKDSVVYQASLDEEANIDKQTMKVVDIIHMDDIQLKKMMFIIDKLTEGLDDDSSNTGNTII
jgi:hypothetical protein